MELCDSTHPSDSSNRKRWMVARDVSRIADGVVRCAELLPTTAHEVQSKVPLNVDAAVAILAAEVADKSLAGYALRISVEGDCAISHGLHRHVSIGRKEMIWTRYPLPAHFQLGPVVAALRTAKVRRKLCALVSLTVRQAEKKVSRRDEAHMRACRLFDVIVHEMALAHFDAALRDFHASHKDA